MTKNIFSFRRFCALLIACVLMTQVQANVLLGGTRVIYNERDKEVTLKLTNEDGQDSLVQVWFDSNDPKSTPETGVAPFIATPPIFRLDKNKIQTLRIMFLQEPLPKDKESVFWVNVLDVPPVPENFSDDISYMQMAIRSRIKLFYRPKDLVGTSETAAQEIQWSLHTVEQGIALRASNAGAFHVSFGSIKLFIGDKKIDVESSMISPGAQLDFLLKNITELPIQKFKIDYETINDYGGTDKHTTAKVK